MQNNTISKWSPPASTKTRHRQAFYRYNILTLMGVTATTIKLIGTTPDGRRRYKTLQLIDTTADERTFTEHCITH